MVNVTVFVPETNTPAVAVAENVYVMALALSDPLAIAVTTLTAVVAFDMSTTPELVPFVLARVICNV